MTDTDKQSEMEKTPDDGTDPIIGKAVGTRLKSLFTEFASEDVPDRFLDLLGQLEEKEQADNDAPRPTSDRDT